jgi:hypothetical protein
MEVRQVQCRLSVGKICVTVTCADGTANRDRNIHLRNFLRKPHTASGARLSSISVSEDAVPSCAQAHLAESKHPSAGFVKVITACPVLSQALSDIVMRKLAFGTGRVGEYRQTACLIEYGTGASSRRRLTVLLS